MQQAFDFDICARKHGGQATSIAANKKAAPGKAVMKEKILDLIARHGKLTLEDAVYILDADKNAISGRFSDLRIRDKKIERTGEVNESGFGYYRLVK